MNFYNLSVIQIAICIIISWALFAIFVSLIQEAFAQILAERGRFMKEYLLQQLNDKPNATNWAALIYLHGTIDLLIRDSRKPTNEINPKLFAEVLIETIGESHLVQTNLQPTNYSSPVLSNFKSGTITLNNSPVIAFLRLALKNAEIKYSNTTANKEALIYQELVKQIEEWFIEMTGRLILWYKKKMRRKLFIYGFILALLINVDSVQLFNFYKMNPNSRAAVQNYYNNYVADSSSEYVPIDTSALATIRSLDSLVKAADLPIGFDHNIFVDKPSKDGPIFWKIIGLFISGFAASFGAPFWFEILKKSTAIKV